MTSAVRDGDEAYARYLRGMDATLRVKVALTAAHVLRGGRVADMGMGSGASSAALAGLYPGLQVVGVDLDPHLVARARREHTLPNLTFVEGDVAARVLPPRTMSAIFDSSVLHHVTSFGGYERSAALSALAVQAEALEDDGVLIVRDFVDPPDPDRPVLLDLPVNDGDASADPRCCSSAALLERFAREFRSLSATPGFPLERVAGAPQDWQRFRLAKRHAVELLLRKDYREDWVAEVREEYGVATVEELAAGLARIGLRVLVASPIRNPWIVRHRLEGKYRMVSEAHPADCAGRSEEGVEELDHPATNALFVAQRVPPGSGVRFEDAGDAAPTGFLSRVFHRHRGTGALRDVVRRPGVTVDIVPFFASPEGVQVVFRAATPRPVVASALATPSPCGALPPTWLAEPLHARMTDRPLGQTVEEALLRLGIGDDRILSLREGTTYDPSPGGIQEEVRSVFVEIEPLVAEAITESSAFRRGGRIQAASALQLLRAAMVGGLFDARLELNVRTLLRRLGVSLGPWLGDEASLDADEALPATTVAALLARPPRRVFRAAREGADFLSLAARRFRELDAEGNVVAEEVLEVVTPARHSTLTVAVLPVARIHGVIHAAVDDDDLPSAQAFTGASSLLVAPAFRVPHEHAASVRRMHAFTRARLREEHGLEVRELIELGGRYGPSPGMTPEVVYPYVARVSAVRHAPQVCWVPLLELAQSEAALRDGHLRVLAGRAAHAYGLS